MAESENSQKPPNQAEFETQAQPKIEPEEEAADEENLVLPPEKSVHSLSPIVVPNFTTETSQSQTLTFSSLISPSDHDPDCHSFSELLAGAMASPTKMSPGSVSKPTVSMIDLPPALDPAGFKGQFGMSHQEALATVTAQAQAQAQRQLQAGSLHILPTSLEQSMVFAMSPTHKREFSPVSQDHTASTPPVNQKASFDPKTGHVNVVKETPCSDGYSWRKYGQKQVKSNERSRSYYKCTDSSCNAKKKVESSDHSGHVVEIVYKGQHNHEPPRKIRSTKASGCVSSAGAIVCVNSGRGNGVVEHPVKELTIPAPSRPEGESCYATCKEIVPVSNDSGRDAGVRHGEEQGDEPQPKRRMKNNRVASSTPQIKTIKDPKVVVQAAGDVGTSVDGYRWRKYGQKMVKGNPSPRSYYRCTSAGCPVRKHVDKAIDEAASIIITYEGKHDHDMPVPKKRNGPPNTPLLIAETCAVNGGKLKSSETSLDQKPSIPLAVEKGDPTGKKTTEVGGEKEKVDPTGEKAVELGGEKEKGDPAGEKAVELGGEKEKGDPAGEKGTEVGGEKVLESARTLLSIGIELKPY